jgi:HEAT repeat protein
MRSPFVLAAGLGLLLLVARPAPAQVKGSTTDTSPGSTAPPSEVEGKTLQQWTHDLKHKDPSVREYAIRAVTLFGPANGDVVTLLLERCLDRDTSPRVRAVMAFQVLELRKDDYDRVATAMARRLREDTETVVKYQAAVVLLRFGEYARPALDALVAGARYDPSSTRGAFEYRQICVLALIGAGHTSNGPDARATRALLGALEDTASRVRLEAVIGLGMMGRPTDKTLRELTARKLQIMTTDTDKSVAIWAHASLMQFEGTVTEAGVKAVAKGLSSTDMHLRLQSAKAIGSLGHKAVKAAPGLVEMLRSKDGGEVVMAIWALGQLGDPGEKATDALKELADAKDGDPYVKAVAKATLDKIKGKPEKK